MKGHSQVFRVGEMRSDVRQARQLGIKSCSLVEYDRYVEAAEGTKSTASRSRVKFKKGEQERETERERERLRGTMLAPRERRVGQGARLLVLLGAAWMTAMVWWASARHQWVHEIRPHRSGSGQREAVRAGTVIDGPATSVNVELF